MLPLREYLATRRADIQAQIKALRAELVEIDAAERSIAGGSGEPTRKERGGAGTGKKTLKELALEILRDRPDGAEAATILSEIKSRYGMDVARESLSPQLSRLGQDGELVRHGLVWMIAPKIDPVRARQNLEALYGHPGRKDETPDGATSGASSLEVDLDDEIPF